MAGVSVLDFSTLLPGPLCTLMLAEAGASVLKVERAGAGDPMRSYTPKADTDGVRFVVLNRGKESLSLDLKSPADRDYAVALAHQADVVVEQFRPGVMSRLGLGYDEIAVHNPRVVYCSITGYGQTGPKAGWAGHDLNYVSHSGMLSLVTDDGRPRLPSATFADIAGGSYPALMNILLALLGRERTGRGTHLDIAMSENVVPLVYWGFANGARGQWPVPDGEVLTGGSPRYNIYSTADGHHIAVAAIEDQFWYRFCDAIGLTGDLRNDARDPGRTINAVAELIAGRSAADWEDLLQAPDNCATLVETLETARQDPHLEARGIFSRQVNAADGGRTEAMHVPLVPQFRSTDSERAAPRQDRGARARPAKLSDFFDSGSPT
nr:CaiB/BaiF CoA-transferase family protein [Ornithinimicrobium sp. HY1745]